MENGGKGIITAIVAASIIFISNFLQNRKSKLNNIAERVTVTAVENLG